MTWSTFGRGSLLLQRLREVGCAFGEVRGALAQFVEKPRVLDGNDGLSSKVLKQLNLLVVEGANFMTDKKNAPIISLLFNNGTPRSVRKPPSVTAVTATGSSCLV